MDLRDFQILLELGRSPFASDEAIGRTIGITGSAVKIRLARMEEHRVLQGMQLIPAPRVFHRHWHVSAYLGVSAKLDLNDLLGVDDVVTVWRGGHGEVMVNSFDPSPFRAPPAGLAKWLKRPPVQVVSLDPPEGTGPADSTLSPLDWRVIGALLTNPRASLTELARRTGLSARTVRRHRDALLERQLITVFPNLDTSREPGLIVYSGYVGVQRREQLDRISLPGFMIFRRLYEPPAGWFLGYSHTLAGVQSVEATLREVPGVIEVNLGPARPGAFATSRLQTWIRKELERWAASRPRRSRRPEGR